MDQDFARTVASPPPTSGVPPLDSLPVSSPEPQNDEPLFTEINIPLPPIPKAFMKETPAASVSPAPPRTRNRSHTLHGMLPFHHRRSSSTESQNAPKYKHFPDMDPETPKDDFHQPQNSNNSSSVKRMFRGRKRNQTVGAGALAVAPAVLILSAELFTPSEEKGQGFEEHRTP